ncbi:hypothetical protein PCASD_05812 [Puccinia coronata f. sp. avenae]|nr:hypothetical protein PCASD_26203 [Puccinia coronata f. sp. avenae]PLW43827.1 hypothetical protein PCASD_05812 [Puccinia coronata f. sp. avenae]
MLADPSTSALPFRRDARLSGTEWSNTGIKVMPVMFGLFYIACLFALLQAVVAVPTIAPRDDLSSTQVKGQNKQKSLLGGLGGLVGGVVNGLVGGYNYPYYGSSPLYGYGYGGGCGYGFGIGLYNSCYGTSYYPPYYPYSYGGLWKKDAPSKTDDASA